MAATPFCGLTPGAYGVRFVPPSGYVYAPRDRGTDEGRDCDANLANGIVAPEGLVAGEFNRALDGCIHRLASVGGSQVTAADFLPRTGVAGPNSIRPLSFGLFLAECGVMALIAARLIERHANRGRRVTGSARPLIGAPPDRRAP